MNQEGALEIPQQWRLPVRFLRVKWDTSLAIPKFAMSYSAASSLGSYSKLKIHYSSISERPGD